MMKKNFSNFYVYFSSALFFIQILAFSIFIISKKFQFNENVERNLYFIFSFLILSVSVVLARVAKILLNINDYVRLYSFINVIYTGIIIFIINSKYIPIDIAIIFIALQCFSNFYFLILKIQGIPRILRWALAIETVVLFLNLPNTVHQVSLNFNLPLQLTPKEIFLSIIVSGIISREKYLYFRNNFKKILLLLFILLIILTSFTITLPYDTHHHNYFLGPLLKLNDGGTMLIDTYSQYGVSLFYFLYTSFKLLGLKISFSGLSLIISLLQTLTFILFFIFSYLSFKKIFIASVATILAILFNFYLAAGYPAYYPSTGFLRFGIIYILAGIFALWGHKLNNIKGQIIAAFFLGLSFIWSIDTFLNTLYIYLAIQTLFLIKQSLFSPLQFLMFSLRVFLFASLAIISFAILLFTFSYFKTLSLPNIQPYLAFIDLYRDDFGLLPIPSIGTWWIFIAIYCFSFFSSLYFISSNNKFLQKEGQILFLISSLGISIFSYYIGRSHSNNLFHVSLPVIFLVVFWAWKLSQTYSHNPLKYAGIYALVLFTIHIVRLNSMVISEKFPSTILGSSISQKQIISPGFIYQTVSDAMNKNEKRWKDITPFSSSSANNRQNKIVGLFPKQISTGIMTQLGRGNEVSLGDPSQDFLIWSIAEPIILKNLKKLNNGDVLIIPKDESSLELEYRQLLDKLRRNYNIRPIVNGEDYYDYEIVSKRILDQSIPN